MIKRLLAGIIFIYQRVISPWKVLISGNQTCRFYPTCSEYARLSIAQFGVFKGGARSIKRLFSCHPFHPGGLDLPE